MKEPFTLDTAGWPLILNHGDPVISTFKLPAGSDGTDEAAQAMIAAAERLTVALNEAQDAGATMLFAKQP